MFLDELPPELLPELYRHLPGGRLWADMRLVSRRFNRSLRRNEYWLRRANDQFGLQLPARLKPPKPNNTATTTTVTEATETEGSSGSRGEDDKAEEEEKDRKQIMPSLRCVAVERAAARWSRGLSRFVHTPDAHFGTIDALRLFRADQKLFCLSGARDRQIALWDLTHSTLSSSPDGCLTPSVKIQDAHKGWIWSLSVVPGAERFYSSGWDSVIQQWQFGEGKIERGLHISLGQIAVLGCIADGPHVLYASTYRQGPLLFDLRVGTTPQRQQKCHGNKAVFELATGPDCELIFSIGVDNRLVAVDKRQFTVLNAYSAPVSHVDYAEGQLCLSTRTGHLLFFNPNTLQLENELTASDMCLTENGGHHMIRLSRGATFLCASSDNNVRVFTPGLRPRLLACSEQQLPSNVTRLDVLGDSMMAALSIGSLTYWPPTGH